jgi:hypothetical protein
MARKYARDNRGRFAAKGTGATARGGRLKTEAGNKREGQTIKAAGGPAGTVGKNRAKQSPAVTPKQQRQLEGERISLKRRADATLARMGYTGVTPGQQVALNRAAKADRARVAQIDQQLNGAKPLPTVLAQGRPLTGERMGNYRGNGRFSLYGADKGIVRAARPSSTVSKPAGLKPGALSPKPAPTPKPSKQGTTKAEKAVAAAKKRLATKQYGQTANQSQNLLIDRRVASMTPRQYAASEVRSARAMVQRTRSSLRNPLNANAPATWRQRLNASLASQMKDFKSAAQDYRQLVPKTRKRK